MRKWFRKLIPKRIRRRVAATPTVWIPSAVLDQTVKVLRRSAGEAGEAHEGIAYWAGHRLSNRSVVTTCIAPGAKTGVRSFKTSLAANAQVVAYVANVNLEVLGQVHSHPASIVDHSLTDDKDALMPYEGFLSVVVPYYGRRGMTPLVDCGIHIFEAGRFRRMARTEVESSFVLIDMFVDLGT